LVFHSSTITVMHGPINIKYRIVSTVLVVWGKVKSSPVTSPEGPRRFQEVKVPRFRDNGTGWL